LVLGFVGHTSLQVVKTVPGGSRNLFGMDIGDLTAGAAAYQLYQRPGLLQRVTEWDGSTTAGPKRAETASDEAATRKRTGTEHAFDHFDQSSWWKQPQKGATVDTHA
jgi:hypothetical protein